MDRTSFNQNIAPIINQKTTIRRGPNFPSLSIAYCNIGNLLHMDNNIFIQNGAYFPQGITAIEYLQDKILYFPKATNDLGISFGFSGCVMAQFKYSRFVSGVFTVTDYIAHVYLEDGHSTKNGWNQFIDNIVNSLDAQFSDFILFKPFDSFSGEVAYNYIKSGCNVSVCGIIDFNRECYSGVMDMNDCTLKSIHRIKSISKVVNGPLHNNNKNLIKI